ncbi:MAG: radical SAM protein [bacterium]|nr:radical SAM protein [bacterium]
MNFNNCVVPEFPKEMIENAIIDNNLLTMEIEFTRACNLNCVYCYMDNNLFCESRECDLTREEFQNVIMQAKDLGVKTIVVLGGEPMLYPYISDMIKFIRKQDLYIEIFSNGINVTEFNARFLFEHDVTFVLKMNTFIEKLQDLISGKEGTYAQIQEAFKNLENAGYLKEKNLLGISSVICNQNIDEIVKLWQWARERKITPYFEIITPQGSARANNGLYINYKEMKDLFYIISNIDRGTYGYTWEPQPPLVGMKCLRHQYSCLVTSCGNVQPCVGVNIKAGNVKEKSLREIIKNSEVIQNLRNYRQTIKGHCGHCVNSDNCYGCRGTAYQLTGDYLASDPLCWKNAERENYIKSYVGRMQAKNRNKFAAKNYSNEEYLVKAKRGNYFL